jgi:hypothetical protein
MPNASLADKLKVWQTCLSAMQPRLEKLVHLQGEHAELLAAIQEIERLLVVEEEHTFNLRETISKRQELERQGRELFGRIDFGLRSHHGKKSVELRQYGIDPLAEPTRRKKEDETKKPPAPAAAAGG